MDNVRYPVQANYHNSRQFSTGEMVRVCGLWGSRTASVRVIHWGLVQAGLRAQNDPLSRLPFKWASRGCFRVVDLAASVGLQTMGEPNLMPFGQKTHTAL